MVPGDPGDSAHLCREKTCKSRQADRRGGVGPSPGEDETVRAGPSRAAMDEGKWMNGGVIMSEDRNLELMAELFGIVSERVVDRFGDEGEEVVRDAVAEFGRRRGERIRRRVDEAEKPATVENYLDKYDMARAQGFEVETDLDCAGADQVFTLCPLWETWKETGSEDGGYLYCLEIDRALARGYDARMEFVHHEHFRDGGGRCRMSFRLTPGESG